MRDYNGFAWQRRDEAAKWLREQVRLGLRPIPQFCQACGQTEGEIVFHTEDYSRPFGDHTGRWTLCRFCHTMLHARFDDSFAWIVYLSELRKGAVYSNVRFSRTISASVGAGKILPLRYGRPRTTPIFEEMDLKVRQTRHEPRTYNRRSERRRIPSLGANERRDIFGV
jgi:hypothetical protein